jgi:hypothetical protein
MTTAAEFRAEAARMREVAMTVTDSEVLSEIQAMIDELERWPASWGTATLPGFTHIPCSHCRSIPNWRQAPMVDRRALT